MIQLLKIYIRSLLKRKVLSAITIGGFAIGMSVIIILTVFIVGERSMNGSYPNFENIYRLKTDNNSAQLPQVLLPRLKNEVPGIQNICFYSSSDAMYSLGKQKQLGSFIATNNEFIDIFSHTILAQNGEINLDIPNQIVITESFKTKLLKSGNLAGQTILLNDEIFNISAVISDPPKNSSFEFDGLIGIENAFGHSTWSNGKVTYNQLYAFVELNNKISNTIVAESIVNMLSVYEPWKDQKLLLQAFNEIYFDTDTRCDLKMANKNLIMLLSWVAIIILLMSIFNFVSLTISTNIDRTDEIGIRKTTGANRLSIFNQHLSESLLACIFAIIFAVVIALLVSPIFSEIVGKHIEIQTAFTNSTIIVMGLIFLVSVGLLAGIYPAFLASRFSPLKSELRKNSIKQKRHRSVILTIQFVVSIVLVSSVLLITKQINYVKNIDHGFNKDLLVKMYLPRNASKNIEVFKSRLMENPQVLNVSATSGGPLNNSVSTWGGNVKGFDGQVNVNTMGVDDNFTNTFGLQIRQGRNLRKGEKRVCLINEHLFNHLRWSDIEGKVINNKKVVGLVKDFHYKNMYHPIGNLQLHSSERKNPYILNVKINGIDITGTISYLKAIFEELDPGTPFEYTFFDDLINTLYKKEEIQAKAIKVFAIIAILISCLGLIGLVEFAIHKKTKEIGVRKVNGAKVSQILTMLNQNYFRWVVAAFIIATPIAYYAMHKWLENFAYKTELSWWIFALAGVLALGIALLTVSWQSWRAATRNPVEALRYE